MTEKRRFKRFSVDLDAKYLKVEGHATISSLAAIKNISLGGVCTSLNKLVRRGDDLMVEFTSPSNRSLAALAKVKWVKEEEQDMGNTCGLEFLWVTSNDVLNDCVSYAEGLASAA
jgi:hypothetical protein